MPVYNYTLPGEVAPAYPPYSNSTFLNNHCTDDAYRFTINGIRSINLNVHNITASDDADLYLHEDDGDGVFEFSDPVLARSIRWGNADDSINYRAGTGTYFARVHRFSSGHLNYEIDISATPIYPSSTSAPNLLPTEVDIGTLHSDQTLAGWVGNTDTADTYAFSVPSSFCWPWLGRVVDISLDGLRSDADIRLIDDGGNDIVDPGEVIRSSTAAGVMSESISQYLSPGDYSLQVFQYSGDTNYELEFNV